MRKIYCLDGVNCVIGGLFNINIGGIFMGKMIKNAKSNGFDVMPKGTFRGGEQQDTETMPKGTFRGGEQQDTETMPKGTFRGGEQQDIETMPKGTFRGGEQQDTETMPKGTFRGGEQGMSGAYIPKRTGVTNNISVKRVSTPNVVKANSPIVTVKAVESGDKEVCKLPRGTFRAG